MYSYKNKYQPRIVAPNRDRILMSAYTRYERRQLALMALAASLVALGMAVGGWHALGGL